MQRVFCTYFPGFLDFHFFKDPGQVPYRFGRLGYESFILTYENGAKHPRTEAFLKVVKIPTKTMGYGKISLLKFMAKNAKRINVLNVFQMSFGSLFAGFIYKLFNRKGFVYLKMDNNCVVSPYPWEKIWLNSRKQLSLREYLMKKLLIRSIGLFSVEDNLSREYFHSRYPFMRNKIIKVVNGHTVDLMDFNSLLLLKKQNIICTASNLGTYPKATDVLLEAFAATADLHDWSLYLAGSIADEFHSYIEDFFKRNPTLRSRIFFCGRLDREPLYRLYAVSKIFFFPSIHETAANVISESLFFGNAILTTTGVANHEAFDRKMGIVVEPDNIGQAAEALLSLIKDEATLKQYMENARRFAATEMNWDHICKQLNQEIQSRSH